MNLSEIFGETPPIMGIIIAIVSKVVDKYVKPWYHKQDVHVKHLITDIAQSVYDGLLLLEDRTDDEKQKASIKMVLDIVKTICESADFGIDTRE